jgi:A/G-specific adenine glycosylase
MIKTCQFLISLLLKEWSIFSGNSNKVPPTYSTLNLMTSPTTATKSTSTQYPSLTRIKWFRQQLLTWGSLNLRDFPWRKNISPYNLLVAESLLQKTDAKTVAPIYEMFLERYPTVRDLAAAPIEDVSSLLQPLGLHFRGQRLQECARIILTEYGGKVPQERERLLKLPGIGDYSARAIASQAFQQPLAVLDANVARILERFFGLQGEKVKSRCKILWGAADIIGSSGFIMPHNG